MTKTVLIAEKFQNGAGLSGYVAEIGNCLICATLGLTPDFEQSGAYIEGWMKAMKEDNRVIFRAASEAQKALDFVQGLTEASHEVAAE